MTGTVTAGSARAASRAAWAAAPPLIRGLGRTIWGLRVEGTFPDPPFVVAANHHSFLDPHLVGAALGRPIRFMALVDLYGRHRLLDIALGLFEAIPVRRGTVPLAAVRTALEHLDTGGVVGVFPEGTRFWEFDRSRARDGAAWLATRTDVPLVPVAVHGTHQVMGVDNRLHRGRVLVSVGPPLRAMGRDRDSVADLTDRWGTWVEAALRPR